MAKIEVGMMVKLVGLKGDCVKKYEGHVGEVLALSKIHPVRGNLFDIDGTDTDIFHFPEDELVPIDPPKESEDIRETREKGAPSFDQIMKELDKVLEDAG